MKKLLFVLLLTSCSTSIRPDQDKCVEVCKPRESLGEMIFVNGQERTVVCMCRFEKEVREPK
jgi:hypothetical protein